MKNFVSYLNVFMLSFFILTALNYSCTEKDRYKALQVDILLDKEHIEIFQGEDVYFSCEAFGGLPPYTYSWNFGVGIPSSSQKVPGFIAFKFEGTTKVTLTVKDSRGTTREDFVYVEVKKKFDLDQRI